MGEDPCGEAPKEAITTILETMTEPFVDYNRHIEELRLREYPLLRGMPCGSSILLHNQGG